MISQSTTFVYQKQREQYNLVVLLFMMWLIRAIYVHMLLNINCKHAELLSSASGRREPPPYVTVQTCSTQGFTGGTYDVSWAE